MTKPSPQIAGHQIIEIHPQGLGEALQHIERWLTLAMFDLGQIGRANPDGLGKGNGGRVFRGHVT
jgi:hypothetical protein